LGVAAATPYRKMNSREKGKRGERAWRDELRAQGFEARRGQQFCGSPDSPDVICDALPWIHFEVKAVERLNIEDAMNQARRDSRETRESTGGTPVPPKETKIPVVAHKRNFCGWLVTMDAETFFKFLRGDFLDERRRDSRETRESTGESPVLPRKIWDAVERIPTEEEKHN
jgi:hypothetical protein